MLIVSEWKALDFPGAGADSSERQLDIVWEQLGFGPCPGAQANESARLTPQLTGRKQDAQAGWADVSSVSTDGLLMGI